MTSQNWIYDPPPPPPKRALPEDTRTYGSQRPANGNAGRGGRGGYRGGGRGAAGQPHGTGAGRGTYNRPQQFRQGNNGMPTAGYSPQMPPYGATGFQQPPIGYLPQNYSFPQMSVPGQSWSSPAYPQQYSMQQPYSPYPPMQYGQQYPQSDQPFPQPQKHNIPAYHQSPSQSQPSFPQPQRNAQGYTLSSTAYSLPEHHFKPVAPERPDLSEDELRFVLDTQMKGLKQTVPIEGTSVRLVSVEDIMAWREERKKKWLSKIAAAPAPKRQQAKNERPQSRGNQQRQQKPEMKPKIEMLDDELSEIEGDEDDLSEGEIVEQKLTPKKDIQNVKKKKAAKVCKKFRQGKCRRGDNCTYLHTKKPTKSKSTGGSNDKGALEENEEKPKSLYFALLQSQMERENIILLQTLLHFRERGLLKLE